MLPMAALISWSVAPYVGAWIETKRKKTRLVRQYPVAPYVGAWIETLQLHLFRNFLKSHPTWVRGLKLSKRTRHDIERKVAPYVGAWIETGANLRNI